MRKRRIMLRCMTLAVLGGLLFVAYRILAPEYFLTEWITDDYKIRQHPFRQSYYLADKHGRMVFDIIGDWIITDRYIFGFCGDGSEYKCYLFDRQTKNVRFLRPLTSCIQKSWRNWRDESIT